MLPFTARGVPAPQVKGNFRVVKHAFFFNEHPFAIRGPATFLLSSRVILGMYQKSLDSSDEHTYIAFILDLRPTPRAVVRYNWSPPMSVRQTAAISCLNNTSSGR
jgi:hypothetical protein